MKSKKYTVKFRRKRETKTDYKARLRLISSKIPRLVLRLKSNSISAQIIEFNPEGDKVLVSTNSLELKKFGCKLHLGNIPSAYLTGLLIGRKALDKKIKKTILDFGFASSTKNSRIYALLKGALDAGLEIPHSEEMLPKEEIFSGKKIEEYASLLSKEDEKFKKQFSFYIKNNLDPKKISLNFEEVKKKILGDKSDK